MTRKCPLCQSDRVRDYSADKLRDYFLCEACDLIFVDRGALISPEAEKTRYDAHENDSVDLGYQRYLLSIAEEILPHLKAGSRGLDFGCGRTTLLAQQFKAAGFPTESYDVYFLPDESIWSQKFDFIVLSEVIEHLRDPLTELKKLSGLLDAGGAIFIKTKFAPPLVSEFDGWFYKRDITHIQFFGARSMEQLKEDLGFSEWKLIGSDLSVLRLH